MYNFRKTILTLASVISFVLAAPLGYAASALNCTDATVMSGLGAMETALAAKDITAITNFVDANYFNKAENKAAFLDKLSNVTTGLFTVATNIQASYSSVNCAAKNLGTTNAPVAGEDVYAFETLTMTMINGGATSTQINYKHLVFKSVNGTNGSAGWTLYGNQKNWGLHFGTVSRNDPAVTANNGTSLYVHVDDPTNVVTNVTISGPGISGTQSLFQGTPGTGWDGKDSTGRKSVFATPTIGTYTLNIWEGTTQTASNKPLVYSSALNTNYPTTPTPNGNYTGTTPPTFSWTAPASGIYAYGVNLHDATGAEVWNSTNSVPGTSLTYSGNPALLAGSCYGYNINALDINENIAQTHGHLGMNTTSCLPNSLGGPVGTGSGNYTSSGTYTWNSGTSAFDLNITSNTFICNGPNLGSNPISGVTVTATTMTWPNDGMTWTRSTGTAGDVVGVWTSTNAGNTYTLTVNSGGTVTLAANLTTCLNVNYGTNTDNNGYHNFNLNIDDPLGSIKSAVLSGGPAGTLGTGALIPVLNMNGGLNWQIDWSNGAAGTFNYTTFPTLPANYTLTITDINGGSSTQQISYTAFNTTFVSNLTPTSITGSTAPTFTWTVPVGQKSSGISLSEYSSATNSWNYNIWSNWNLNGANSALYTGTLPLPACSQINVSSVDINNNMSILIQYLGSNLSGQTCGAMGITNGGPGSQTITFGTAPSIAVGGTGMVSATGGLSYNPVIFTSTTPSICTVSGTNGSTVSGVATGSCIIAADQAGNGNFNAAAQVTQSISIGGAAAGINFDQMIIRRSHNLPNTSENFSLSLRYPRSVGDGLSSYSITCPGAPASTGVFSSATTGFEWVNAVNFGSAQPANQTNCTSTVTYTNSTTNTATATIDRFIAPTAYVTALSLAANANVQTAPNLSWTNPTVGPTTGSYTYQGNVFQSGNVSSSQQLFFVGGLSGSPITYAGPALSANMAYQYDVATSEAAGNKLYFAEISIPFCYQCTSTAHSATGTYIWTPATSTVDLTWLTSDFTCGNGPNLGVETVTGVTVGATSMTWLNGPTWSRANGTASDILGTWTSDSITSGGVTFTLTINANLTMTATATTLGTCVAPVVDTTPPSVPTNLAATPASATQVNLSWTASTDNVGVTSYRVYRVGSLIASPTGTSYNDTGLTASTQYSYTVAACDAASNCSAQTSPVTVNTLAPPTSNPMVGVWKGQINEQSLFDASLSINSDLTYLFSAVATNGSGSCTESGTYTYTTTAATTTVVSSLAKGTAGCSTVGQTMTIPFSGVSGSGVGSTMTFPLPQGASFANAMTLQSGGIVSEFPLPAVGSDTPLGITTGPDGNLWFVEGNANKIAKMTTTGAITEYPINTLSSQPQCIINGPDGNLWFVEGMGNKIGKITTAGFITEYSNPTGSQPSGFPQCLTVGPDNNLWYADQGPIGWGGSSVTTGNGSIGMITTAGVITKFPVPTANSEPDFITTGPDGNLWFTYGNDKGVGFAKVGRITPAGVVTEFPTPTVGGGMIVTGSDGAMWFTEAGSKIARVDTTGNVTEFALPPDTNPFGITSGPDGALWFTEAGNWTPTGWVGGGQKIGRITTSGLISEYSIPTSTSRPGMITVGPDNALWFSEIAGNKIGRITLPPPAINPLGAHTASGNYTWTPPAGSATGTIGFNWTFSNFIGCVGPSIGFQSQTGVALSGSTMTWPNNGFSWTQTNGTAGSLVGTWTGTDPTTGNAYTATFGANGTVSASATINNAGNCGGSTGTSGNNNIQQQMRTDQGPNGTIGPRQHVNLDVNELPGTVSSVSVTGPGITNALVLTQGPTRIASGVTYDSFYGGFDPTVSVTSGAVYTFTETPVGGGSTTSFTQTYTGTAVTNTTTGAISIISPTGYALSNASLGSPLTVQWTLPTAYTVAQVKLDAYVQTSTIGSNAGYQCWINGPALAANATSGSITLPTVCGPNNDPVIQAGINVSTIGTLGESSIDIYQFIGSVPALTIQTATITLDGLTSDWGGIAALATLPTGQGVSTVAGTPITGDNIHAIYAAQDGTNLYLRLDMYDAFNTAFWNYPAAPNNGRYTFVVNTNSTTYPSLVLGVAYGPGGQWAVGANGGNGSAPTSLQGPAFVSVSGSVMELKIPLASIGSPTAVTGIQAQVNDCCFMNGNAVQPPTVLGLIGTSGTNLGNGFLLPRLGGQALYDPDKNVTWLTNASLATSNNFGVTTGIATDGSMTLSTAQSWIAGMNAAHYQGFSDWRLPSTVDPDSTCPTPVSGTQIFNNCTGSELGHLFSELGGVAGTGISTTHNANYSLFANIAVGDYWSGTASVSSNGYTWAFLLDGVAASPAGYQTVIPTANTTAHVFAVRTGDVYAGATGTVTPIAQTISAITFQPTTLTVNGTTTVSATGGASGNAVIFSSTTTSVCTVSGTTVLGVTAGTCTVAANQAGNSSYSAASQVTQNITVTSGGGTGTTLTFVPNWNLVGNSVEAPLTVANAFGDPAKVNTVWKWLPSGQWAFYTPALGDGGQAYAQTKGYVFLTTINAGEGFWVNAKTQFTASLPPGAAVQSSSFMPATTIDVGGAHALPHSWSLISTGDGLTPAQFDAAIATAAAVPPSQQGNVYTSLTTLWAWDAAHSSWYFWAPNLVNSSSLSGYITSKIYQDFATMPSTPTGTLSPTTGFWVNMP